MKLARNFKKAVNASSQTLSTIIDRGSKTLPKTAETVFDGVDLVLNASNRAIRDGNKYNDKKNTQQYEKYCGWIRSGKYTKKQIHSWFASDKEGWQQFKKYMELWEKKNPLPQPQSQPKATS